MRLLTVNKIKEDMVCAKTVFTANGTILINKGTKIKCNYIERLLKHGIKRIYVENDLIGDIEIDDIIKDEAMQKAISIVDSTMNNISYYQEIDIEQIRSVLNTIIKDLFDNDNLIVQIMEIRAINEYTLEHCVKVAVLSLLTGLTLGYSKDELMDLGTGAILHDVGKALIPKEIINKPSQLTKKEYDIIKEHTNLGYKAIRRQNCVDDKVCDIILLHHERYDGKGYPTGLKGDEIPEYVKIVSIADVYDALTTDRVYRKRVEVSMAIEYLISMGGIQFDYTLVRKFIKNIALYPIGKGIILNTKEKGFVVNNFKNFPTRPVVKIVYDSDGKKLSEPYEINLINSNSITIVATFNDV